LQILTAIVGCDFALMEMIHCSKDAVMCKK